MLLEKCLKSVTVNLKNVLEDIDVCVKIAIHQL